MFLKVADSITCLVIFLKTPLNFTIIGVDQKLIQQLSHNVSITGMLPYF